jgi:lipopolysaccharide transport system ATP-binding protein
MTQLLSPMSDIVIQADNLGKKYTIGHQAENGRYTALRDVVMQNARSLWHKTRDLVQGKPIIQGDTLEEVWALKDVSFDVRRGEAVGIIGRNGAGKSTLLKILSRITEPSAGRVTIKGRVASLLEVGTGFHPELTGRENIYLNGAILGMTRQEIKRKFDEIVAFAEVEQYLDTPVKRYSSGMYVRLAFAVAAYLEPEILVVDEVLAVGDVAFQKKCLGMMGNVAKEGRTVVFVSHNIGAINDLCHRCLMLENGHLAVDGPTGKVVQAYLSQGFSTTPILHLESIKSDAYFNTLGLYDVDSTPTTHFDIKRPITIFLGFTLERRLQGLSIGIDVFNFKGEHIFYHSNTYADPPVLFEEAGTYYATANIPGKFLLPGSYSISVALHRPNIQFYDNREHILTFEIEETGSGRYEYPPQTMGHVLVDLQWEKRPAVP